MSGPQPGYKSLSAVMHRALDEKTMLMSCLRTLSYLVRTYRLLRQSNNNKGDWQ